SSARFTAPAMADIDDDGDLDAALGVGRGSILFYENVGSAQNPVFAAPVADWGGVLTTDSLNTFNGRAAPVFVELDGDPTPELLVGNASGVLRLYDNVSKTGLFEDKGLWTERRLGVNIRPTIAREFYQSDTFSTNDSLVWVAGTARGGLIMFRSAGRRPVKRKIDDVSRAESSPMSFCVYPCPATDKIWIHAPFAGEVEIFDFAGRKRAAFRVPPRASEWDVSFLQTGVYLLRLKNAGTARLVKR
ncbi:MAG: T9SS type A sorting domain-containing protein, partial [Bacteroidia bacterium]|nr:T9SS type A sorting domain-containing protein [Bacteroidia bacterium]MDW8334727.1 T9SS type A sorting domain-containing protein [Bacteroidia bacterium]